ncbi:MAG: hypothetical protein KBT75_16650 [Oleispira antarctica]|uniref:Uncharacterized protein n=1 Tax=Oleispira antarctica RB-8 TaxID=698738 RepID=R4YRE0_OLEAN|nr:hypothetical protein [Oleispira antarctica]MBQ0793895.1 hypothetical protein [Oleispira antarctica]CCK74674.1 hypothetical protein OLEAN_C04980 [Oleispira antarctica RB-8]
MKISVTQALAVIITALAPSLSWAINPHDKYYDNDIFTAINEAKRNPHHYDYSTAKRYNRSTTQSLDIPRLLNQEMSITSIESQGESPGNVADDSVNQQQYEINAEGVTENRILPINTGAPSTNNSGLRLPSVITNVIAR